MNAQNAALEISIFFGAPLSIISDCLRGFIVAAPDHDLIICDFSSIESRIVNWLADEKDVLKIFEGDGKIYEYTASRIFNIPIHKVTKDQRQLGKVAELALCYGGGQGAFQLMCRAYGVKVTNEKAEAIKRAFRNSRPKLVAYWLAMENAAKDAVIQSGITISTCVGKKISFLKSGSFLMCELPSKRKIYYPFPRVDPILTPYGQIKDTLTFMGENTVTRQWERLKSYGAKITENVTQAIARDLLVEAMFRLEEAGYPIVMHVHDEVVCEVKKGFGSVEEMEALMSKLPLWAKGLPVTSIGYRGDRYQK